MMNELNVEGMSIAPGVVETIVSIAATEVEGVALIGSRTTSGLRSVFGGKPSTSGIEIQIDEDEKVAVTLHIEVYYGFVLPDLAAKLRQAIADALRIQAGVEVTTVDVYIDGIQFEN